ncbi:MAG: dUTP diphosphatase [Eubacterium sp.]|nr:dUTP diphosphatase [Eubacterium sp.]
MTINVKKVKEGAVLPLRATAKSAGADLYACLEKDVIIQPGERMLIATGIAVEIPDGFGGFVFPRSGNAIKKGMSMANAVGVIDSDYRGEISVPLINLGSEPFTVSNGDRIAQFIVIPIELCDYAESESLGVTERNQGGFGSTGEH